MYSVQQQRPAGVSVLAILSFVSGVFWIIGGLVLVAIFVSVGGVNLRGIAALLTICSGLFIVIGLIEFIIGWGLWTLQGWAWTVSVILAIIGLINFPIGTIISIIILIYLFKPEIKVVFGKGPPPLYPPPYAYPPYGPPGAPPGQPPPLQSWTPPQAAAPPPPSGEVCKNCGAPLQVGRRFCSSCGAKVG